MALLAGIRGRLRVRKKNSENCLSLDKAEAELAHKRNVATECKLYWRPTGWRRRRWCWRWRWLATSRNSSNPSRGVGVGTEAEADAEAFLPCLDVDSCDTHLQA